MGSTRVIPQSLLPAELRQDALDKTYAVSTITTRILLHFSRPPPPLQRAAVHAADEEDADARAQEHRAARVAAAVQKRDHVH